MNMIGNNREKSMSRKFHDKEITKQEYFDYLELQRSIPKEKTMKQRLIDKEITRKEYDDYLKPLRDTTKEKTMRQKLLDREITSKEYQQYCLSKIVIGETKEKSMRLKYLKGEITVAEYRKYLANKNGFQTYEEYDDFKAQKRGFKGYMDKFDHLAVQRGFKNHSEYASYNNHKSGRCRPQSENKECSNYLGIVVAEDLISKIFGNFTRMPPNFSGYDVICGKDYKIDIKSSCIRKIKNRKVTIWSFNICKNKIADYFLLLAFDSRHDLNPVRVWLIKGTEIVGVEKQGILNDKSAFDIHNNQTHLDTYKKYELTDKLEKLKECCNTLKNKKN